MTPPNDLDPVILRVERGAEHDKSYQTIVVVKDHKAVDPNPIMHLFCTYQYYLVSKAGHPKAVAQRTEVKIPIKDFKKNRTLTLHVSCRVQCEPGREHDAAAALSDGDTTDAAFDLWVTRWISEMVSGKEATFIDTFFDSRPGLEEHIVQRAREIGLLVTPLVRLPNEDKLGVIKLDPVVLEISPRDVQDKFQISVEATLKVDPATAVCAHLYANLVEELKAEAKHKVMDHLSTVPLHKLYTSLHESVLEDTIKVVDSHINRYGRAVERLVLKLLNVRAEEHLEHTHTFRCELNDYPDPVKVTSRVQMSLVDLARYWNADKPDLQDWLRAIVERETKQVLFEVTYALLCEHSEEKKKTIERAVRVAGERIGYHVRQVITLTDLQFDTLKEPFPLDCEGQFGTMSAGVLVGLEFAGTARIPDPQKIQGLLNRRANVREEVQEGMKAASAAILHETMPEDFYVYFHYRADGKPTVAQRLAKEIQTALMRDYGASDVRITCKAKGNQITDRLAELKAKAWEFYLKVAPKGGEIEVGLKGALSNIGVLPDPAAWGRFAERLPTGERLMAELQNYVEAKLYEERRDVLISSESREVSKKIQGWLDGWLKVEYGLHATVMWLQLTDVLEDEKARDLKKKLIEQGHALGQASIKQVAMVTDGRRGILASDVDELRATREDLMASLRKALKGGLQDEIDELKQRVKELDDQIDKKLKELGDVYKDLAPQLSGYSVPTGPTTRALPPINAPPSTKEGTDHEPG